MRWALLVLLLPAFASAQVGTGLGTLGDLSTGPRILGEPAFAFEADLLAQAEASRSAFPITTTRASTAMCQLSDGTWQTVVAGVPCIGAKGMESWAGTTNYWTNSADFSLKTQTNTPSPVLQPDGSWLLTDDNAGAFEGFNQAFSGVAGETWTISCLMKRGTTTTGLLGLNASDFCNPTWPASEGVVSCTKTLTAAGLALLYPSTSTGTAFVRSCWLEKSSTPGPRIDCGGSPCSRAADSHTTNPAGWPVASGEIRLRYTPAAATSTNTRMLVRATSANGADYGFYIHPSGQLVFLPYGPGVTSPSSVLTWVAGQEYEVAVQWGGGVVRLYRDGVLVGTNTGRTMPSGALTGVYLGIDVNTSHANGAIRLVRVSQ